MTIRSEYKPHQGRGFTFGKLIRLRAHPRTYERANDQNIEDAAFVKRVEEYCELGWRIFDADTDRIIALARRATNCLEADVEKIAQAIADNLMIQPKDGGQHGCTITKPLNSDLDMIVRGYVSVGDLARAALDAMRKQSEKVDD